VRALAGPHLHRRGGFGRTQLCAINELDFARRGQTSHNPNMRRGELKLKWCAGLGTTRKVNTSAFDRAETRRSVRASGVETQGELQ
jgi:hypothetical protein